MPRHVAARTLLLESELPYPRSDGLWRYLRGVRGREIPVIRLEELRHFTLEEGSSHGPSKGRRVDANGEETTAVSQAARSEKRESRNWRRKSGGQQLPLVVHDDAAHTPSENNVWGQEWSLAEEGHEETVTEWIPCPVNLDCRVTESPSQNRLGGLVALQFNLKRPPKVQESISISTNALVRFCP